MLKIVKVVRFSDNRTRISDIICIFAAGINKSLKKMAISKKKSRLTYECISKI